VTEKDWGNPVNIQILDQASLLLHVDTWMAHQKDRLT